MDDEVIERLRALGERLAADLDHWTVMPFKVHAPAWTEAMPEVAAWLRARPSEQIPVLESDPWAVDGAPRAWLELAEVTRELAAVGPLPPGDPLPPAHWLARAVKGRKWDQVRLFEATAEPWLAPAEGEIVEWCSGRGHLGRTLSVRLGRPARLLERDEVLCAPPAGRFEREGVQHVCVDVLEPGVEDHVPDGAALVGLHACGRLTERLVDVAIARGVHTVAASPCCPHRLFGPTHYTPQSQTAKASGLSPSSQDLRLAITDEVVPRPRQRAQRHRELTVRTALDLLAREASGVDAYHGFPSVPRSWFEDDLSVVASRVVAEFGLSLPAHWDPEATERRAAALTHELRGLGLLRMLYRRVLELWVVLDRAATLREAGWSVRVGTFCGVETTPRNLLIVAEGRGRGGG